MQKGKKQSEMKILKNPLIVTCTVDKEMFEYVKVNYFYRYYGKLNNAEIMRKCFEYVVEMEEADKNLAREKEARMFRF
ncbi:unnamed protein product [marine sediment metagenome]|uniref:Uncharacterized protein n=1 Tax=marine sediment metagenome TaxID=412755 RepID=X1CZL3_9ZZZZ